MTDQKTISAPIVKAVVEILIELNLPANKFCKKLNINLDALTSAHDRISETAFGGLMHMVRMHSNIPNLGLLIGKRLLPSALGQFWFNLMTTDNEQEIINCSKKYQHQLSNSLSFDIKQDADNYTISIGTNMPHSLTNDFIMDIVMANAHHNTRRILGNNELRAEACHFSRAVPDNIDKYKETFDCPVSFGQGANTIVVPIKYLDRKSLSRNKQIDEITQYEHQHIAASSEEQNLTRLVKEQILNLLPTGDISMTAIAHSFNTSERTLLRRLKAEGYTFLALVDQIRKRLAKHYIEKTEFSFQEITLALGFKDSSTYYRAFKRWYGQTPRHFKKLLAAEQVTASTLSPTAHQILLPT